MNNFILSESEQEMIETIGTITGVGTATLTGLSVVGSITGTFYFNYFVL